MIGKVALYNFEEDLAERENLSIESSAENKAVIASLLKELTTWRKQNKVPLPTASILEF